MQWTDIVGASQAQEAVLPRVLLVLGDNGCGKTELLRRISHVQHEEESKRGRRRVPFHSVTERSVLEYEFFDVFDEDNNKEGLGVVHTWRLSSVRDGELIRMALPENFEGRAIIVIVVDLSEPWMLEESLDKWAASLRSHFSVSQRGKIDTGYPTLIVGTKSDLLTEACEKIVTFRQKRNLSIHVDKNLIIPDNIPKYIEFYIRRRALEIENCGVAFFSSLDMSCRKSLFEYVVGLLFDDVVGHPGVDGKPNSVLIPIGADTEAAISRLAADLPNVQQCSFSDIIPFQKVPGAVGDLRKFEKLSEFYSRVLSESERLPIRKHHDGVAVRKREEEVRPVVPTTQRMTHQSSGVDNRHGTEAAAQMFFQNMLTKYPNKK